MAATDGVEHYLEKSIPLGVDNHAVFYFHVGKSSELTYSSLPSDVDITLAVKFSGSGNVYNQILAGEYDEKLDALISKIKESDRPLTLRIMPEFNGNWNPDGAYAKVNRPEDFSPSFRYVTDYFRDRLGSLVVGIDLNYNRSSAGPDGIEDFERLYPGDRYVDIVTVSTYNRCGAGPYHTTQQSFTEGFQKAYAALDFVDKPLGIAEISTTSLCDPDKIAWFEDMMSSLKLDFPRVAEVTFFFKTVSVGAASNDVPLMWGIESQDVAAFQSLIALSRASARPGRSQPEEKSATPGATTNPTAEEDEYDVSGRPKVKYPWVFISNYSNTMTEAPNTVLSPVTNTPFGPIGTVWRTMAYQGVELEFNSGISIGARAGVHFVESNNNRHWWNNATTLVAEPQVCYRGPFAGWNILCVYGGVNQIEFHVPTTDRYTRSIFSEYGDFRTVVGARFGMGGDWGN
jgi:hypothetical protein